MSRTVDSATYAAVVAAPESGLKERNLVTVFARELDGSGEVQFAFWNDLDTVSLPVIDGRTGATVSRNFVGDGALLGMDRIPLTSDLTIRTVRVQFSQIHATVQDMVRGHDIRSARIEIHRLLFNPQTGAVIAPGIPHFVGKVNKAPISTPRIGDEGSIDIESVSTTRELTRTNPAKKSDETQKRRGGDRSRRYIGNANVKIWWGTEKANAVSGGGASDLLNKLGLPGGKR